MKTIKFVVLLSLLAPLGGCITAKPITLDARPIELGLAPQERLPLKVAVVVPDPMGWRLMFTPAGRGPRDQTNEFKGEAGYPLTRELSRVTHETFTQVFEQVTPLRQLPDPGQYDAVITASIGNVNLAPLNASMGGGGGMNLDMEWKLAAMNGGNVEVFSRNGKTPNKVVEVKASFSTDGFVANLGKTSSDALSELARDWALVLRRELYSLAHPPKTDKP
jgi:hypothetical protein